MSLLYWNKDKNIIEINDESVQHKKWFYIIFSINIFNAVINVSRLFKEEFNFLHGLWIVLGLLSTILLFDMRKRDFSNSISVFSVLSYKHKKNIFNESGQWIIYLSNKKRRVINIATKKQMEESEIIFQELNITKH